MKIVYIITRADSVGGATVHVRDMAEALIAGGDNVTVLVGGQGPVTEQLVSRNIPVRSLRNLVRPIHPVRDGLAVIEIARILRELKPDLISTHTAKAGMVGRAAARLAGIPAVFSPHGWTISDRISPRWAPVFRTVERMAAAWTERIVNVCGYERDLALRHRIAPAEKLAIVYNGTRDIPPGLRADPRRQPPRIVMVARFEEPKDHATLLRALGGMLDSPWELDLIGDGPLEKSARRLSTALGMAGRVHFRGSCGDVAERLAQCQIFALASRSEAFPLSILEAMSAGLPVAASDVGGVGEAVDDGTTGLLSPSGDVERMRANLAALAGDPALRQKIGAAGRRRYEERFTFDHMLGQIRAIYLEAAEAHQRTGGRIASPENAGTVRVGE